MGNAKAWEGVDGKAYSGGGSVVQGWVFAPSNTLIWGEPPWPLAFEEEDAFPKRIVVVVAGGEWTEREEEEEEGEDANCGNTRRERESIARHFLLLEQGKMETVVVLIVEKRHWIPDFEPITYGHVETLLDDC